MPTHPFYQLDVFTDTPLAGNPLAVFPDAAGIDDATMQALAREMNLSETTFVLPSDRATKRVRFFTPTAEIPLAGHPTIGTWWILSQLGRIDVPTDAVHRVTQETGAGVLPVDIDMGTMAPNEVVMVQGLPEFGKSVADPAALEEALGGERGIVAAPAPQVVSTALPQLMIPIRSVDALTALPRGGTGSKLAAFLRDLGTDCAMCYVLEDDGAAGHVRCRMFAPGLGVPEDPATGSAAGALGCYLVWHGLVRPHDGVGTIVVDQGREVGRPSRIHVEIAVGNGGEITEVRVGGRAVTVINGEIHL
jgi:trans-2,3-dihydro-3-hydroxyanthranilate isomerase